MSILSSFQLLELNVISAQDLQPVSRSMRTYAVGWVHPNRKLSTKVDTHGHNNPTWNDKFVFRVDNDFLRSDTSAVMIEIFAVSWFRDVHVGTVRVLVGNLIPALPRSDSFYGHLSQDNMQFVALHVRRPSGRPQGILNIGVAVLRSSMRTMPLYSQLSASAIGYRQLMGEEDPHQIPFSAKPALRRTKSDSSSMIVSELRVSKTVDGINKASKSKSSSMIDGSSRGTSVIRYSEDGKTASIIEIESSVEDRLAKNDKTKSKSDFLVSPSSKIINEKTIGKIKFEKSFTKLRDTKYGTPIKSITGRGDTTESELGASSSKATSTMVKSKIEDGVNSSLMGAGAWSLEGNLEGLQSKLQRWRMELPAVNDRGEMSTNPSSESRKAQRKTEGGGGGLFSCFSNICGCQCSIVCGSDTAPKKSRSMRVHTSSSADM